VKRLFAGFVLGTCLASLVLIVVRVVLPAWKDLEVDVYVLVVGAMALLAAIFATRRAFPIAEGSSLADAMEREARAPVRPPDLERTERMLSMAATTAFDLHFRLRPVLREVAEQRLADRRGLRLDSGDPRVAETCGDELWEVVRPDREAPDRRYQPGLRHAELERVVERLELIQ
jgi:hypothetical protein